MKKQSTETNSEWVQMLNLADFKAAVINVLKEAKETMSKIKEKYDDNDSIKRESKLKNTSHKKKPKKQF